MPSFRDKIRRLIMEKNSGEIFRLIEQNPQLSLTLGDNETPTLCLLGTAAQCYMHLEENYFAFYNDIKHYILEQNIEIKLNNLLMAYTMFAESEKSLSLFDDIKTSLMQAVNECEEISTLRFTAFNLSDQQWQTVMQILRHLNPRVIELSCMKIQPNAIDIEMSGKRINITREVATEFVAIMMGKTGLLQCNFEHIVSPEEEQSYTQFLEWDIPEVVKNYEDFKNYQDLNEIMNLVLERNTKLNGLPHRLTRDNTYNQFINPINALVEEIKSKNRMRHVDKLQTLEPKQAVYPLFELAGQCLFSNSNFTPGEECGDAVADLAHEFAQLK